MGRKIRISKEDQQRGSLVSTPGYYGLEIVGYKNEKAKKDPTSTNDVVDFKIIGGAHKGQTKRVWFSEKAPGFMTSFALALGAQRDAAGDIEFEISEAIVGMKLSGYIRRATDGTGKEVDNVSEFRPFEDKYAA